jgi:serine/threonine protein kinase
METTQLTPVENLAKTEFHTAARALPLIASVNITDPLLDLLFHEQLLCEKITNTGAMLRKKEEEQKQWRRQEGEASKKLQAAKDYPESENKDSKAGGKNKSSVKKKLTDEQKRERDKRMADAELDLKRAANACTLYDKSLTIARELEASLLAQQKAHAETSDKALGTHFRKESVRLHPDRNPGQDANTLRDQFDEFKINMDILRDATKRTMYLTQMLKVQKTMPQYTNHGHDVWMKKFGTSGDETDKDLKATKKTADDDDDNQKEPSARSTRVARIDMGNQSVTPRIPMLLYFSSTHVAKILITIPSSFTAHLPVTIKYEVLTKEGKAKRQISLVADEQQKEVHVDFQQFGHYEFRFCVETGAHVGHWSNELEVIHHDPKEKDVDAEIVRVTGIAKVRVDNMKVCIRKTEHAMDNNALMQNPTQVRTLIDELHKATVRATNTVNILQSMRGSVFDENLQRVFNSCESGQRLLKFLEEKYTKKEKKDVNRAFVRFIAEMLETHRFDEWLSDRLIGRTDIENCCEGGNMNRLYQMLAEGKKASLEISSFVCEAAATREDWFTKSQQTALNKRAEDLRREEQEQEDAEAAEEDREQSRRQLDEELQRQSNEERLNPAPPPAPPAKIDFKGKPVVLLSMSDNSMNGRSGVVQPYELGEDSWAVKLTTPLPTGKSAVTVYTHQLRLMTPKEIKKAQEDQEKYLSREKNRLEEEARRKEKEQEAKDEAIALKLVQQSIQRDQGGVPLPARVAPAPAAAAKMAPKQTAVTGEKRHSGVVVEFAKGTGYIKFDQPVKKREGKKNISKIFFHFKEVHYPDHLDATLSQFGKNKWRTSNLSKGVAVTLVIGSFFNAEKNEENEVAKNIRITKFEPGAAKAAKAKKADPKPVATATSTSAAVPGSWAGVASTARAAAAPAPHPPPPAPPPAQADFTSDSESNAMNSETMTMQNAQAAARLQAPAKVLTPLPLQPPGFGGSGNTQYVAAAPYGAPSFFGSNFGSGDTFSNFGDLGGGGDIGLGGGIAGGLADFSSLSSLSELNANSTPFGSALGAAAPSFTMSGYSLTQVDNLSFRLSLGSYRGVTKLRKFAMAYLGQKLLAQVQMLRRSAIDVDGRFSYYPFVRLGSLQQDVFRGSVTSPGFIKPCAVKRLSKANHNMQEVNILRKLAHENIVMVEDFANANMEFFYIALELCHGDLEHLIETTPARLRSETDTQLPRPVTSAGIKKDLVTQILRAVTFLHQKDVAHRDLKPTNVLFVEKNKGIVVKVADFGISKALDDTATSYTMTSMAGSKGYQAQELVQLKLNELADQAWRPTKEDFKKADIFSFGLLAYYCLTGGLHPFSNPDPRRSKRIGDRETRIADGLPPNLDPITDPEAKHFFQTSLNHKAAIRPNADALYGRSGPKHPFFFTPKIRMNIIGTAERICKGNVNLGKSCGLDLLERICSSSLNWKEQFEDIFEADGGMQLGNGDSIFYRKTGRDLIRFARNVNEHYHEYHIMSKLKVSVLSAGGGTSHEEAISKWLQQRTPLLWLLLFEDQVSLD